MTTSVNILNLPVAVTLDGSEYFPLVQGNTTKRAQVSAFDLTGGAPGTAQSANTVFAGPATGSSAFPTFRALVPADFPAPFLPPTSDGSALGNSSIMWSDLFLATGGVINWGAGNQTLTHSAGVVTLSSATNKGSLTITNVTEAGNNFLYLDGMSRGLNLGNYRTKFVRGNPGMVTNGYVSINGGTGENPTNVEDSFMLQLVSDVEPNPCLLIGAATAIRTYDGAGDSKSRESELIFDGGRNGTGWNIYNHQTFVSASNCQNLFMRWDTNEAQIGTESPGAATDRNLRVIVPASQTLYLDAQTTGFLNISSKFITANPNTRNFALISSDVSLGSILSFRQESDTTYGFDWVFDNSNTALRLDTIIAGVHASAISVHRTTGNVTIPKGLAAGQFATPKSALTIASGVITVTTAISYAVVDTEAAAGSDDLDTINGGVDGARLVIRAANDARTVVVKDGTGNIQCGGDRSLDNTQDTIELIYDGTLTAWLEIAFANNGA